MKATDKYLKSKDKVDLTSMIDVVFLLLIFFMVTTTIVKQESDVSFKLPTNVPAAADAPLPEEHLIDILPDGSILLNGAPAGEPQDNLLPELEGILHQIRESSERAGFQTLVLVSPDESSTQQAIINVLNACIAAKVTSVTFAQAE
ncbi:ExbD/TolR family protein [Coraliomargarita akajimensis]|uniref:Biopolymer transport protein ExbD/TolR n=1 Tax=Coraliomargarita akajimensis (strain DSM 45221 / IAM 15411 / JCM 23193 / KCTC 12865 / 04OKA010-24) TaxID=583355 RepID=D5EN75_CORAD|nr:biopolymer transporter ExbD [Coraliomargarita akajimensis]ADE53510.1 Biopolymer transport protein ExbD/TolR [Coraliomargarita akajimensis DSM 45221]